MNRTVFCTFDHRDIADLSMGKLKAAVPGVLSANYVDDGYGSINGGYQNNVGGFHITTAASSVSDTVLRPARPITLKIVCDENSQQRVVSKLINLHAYRIVAT
jgi:hypothetical protein